MVICCVIPYTLVGVSDVRQSINKYINYSISLCILSLTVETPTCTHASPLLVKRRFSGTKHDKQDLFTFKMHQNMNSLLCWLKKKSYLEEFTKNFKNVKRDSKLDKTY